MSFHLHMAARREREIRKEMEPVLKWSAQFDGRYNAVVEDCGDKIEGWRLTVTDTRTGGVILKCRAEKPYSTLKIEDAAQWWKADTERAVHSYERWGPPKGK
jgi:hypothetical protein